MRIRMQERTHAYRHELHTRLREAEESKAEHEQEITQFQILEEYAATVEGALNIDGLKPFGYAHELRNEINFDQALDFWNQNGKIECILLCKYSRLKDE